MTERVTPPSLRWPTRWLRGIGIAGTLAPAIAMFATARAQSNYPNRPVQIIVPYGAGGIADTGMRILADKLSDRLKQQFIVENRPGAGGIVAAKAGASARPDGHTVLMTGNNNAISASLFKSLPYDILADFASTSTTSFFDLLIVTRAGSALKSVPDIVAMARTNPGRLNIAGINPGQHPKSRRRAVSERRRYQGDDRAVPDVARHGNRDPARRCRYRLRVLCGAARADRRREGYRPGFDRRETNDLSARHSDGPGERRQRL
jgi:hypothetical protein